MTSAMQPITVHTGSADRDGRLVMIDGELVAVIVRLAASIHGKDVGRWHVEAIFDRTTMTNQTFATEAEVGAWFVERYISRDS